MRSSSFELKKASDVVFIEVAQRCVGDIVLMTVLWMCTMTAAPRHQHPPAAGMRMYLYVYL
jgi:hypothetical protein